MYYFLNFLLNLYPICAALSTLPIGLASPFALVLYSYFSCFPTEGANSQRAKVARAQGIKLRTNT